MDFKPSDFNLSARDFLAIVVPGSLISFALSPLYSCLFGPSRLFPVPVGTSGAIAAFLISAYVLGHLLDAVASSILDRLYDRTYRNLKRLPLVESESLIRRLARAWVLENGESVDPLRDAARSVYTTHLKKIGLQALGKAEKSPSIYDWAQSAIVLRASDGAREVEALQAASKLFRSMSIVVILVPLFGLIRLQFTPDRVPGSVGVMRKALVVGLLVSIALMLRFMKLRWTATQRTYEYYILSQTTPPVEGRRDRAAPSRLETG